MKKFFFWKGWYFGTKIVLLDLHSKKYKYLKLSTKQCFFSGNSTIQNLGIEISNKKKSIFFDNIIIKMLFAFKKIKKSKKSR